MSTGCWIMIAVTVVIVVVEYFMITDKIHIKKKEVELWQDEK